MSILMAKREDAYGASIARIYEEEHGRDPSLGAIYTALDRLEKKGFVSSAWGLATAERGGRRKRLYTITAAGRLAMTAASESVQSHAILKSALG